MNEDYATKIIKDFITETPKWYLSHFDNNKDKACTVCGVTPSNLIQLRNALLLLKVIPDTNINSTTDETNSN